MVIVSIYIVKIWIWVYFLANVASYSLKQSKLQTQGSLSSYKRAHSFLKPLTATCIVTGCTGVLGGAFLRRLQQEGHHTHGVFRRNVKFPSSSLLSDSAKWHLIPLEELADEKGLELFLEKLDYRNERELVLINNAARYDFQWSQDALQLSLKVNFFLPIAITDRLIAAITDSSSHQYEHITIINVSSGDGELTYLDPSIVNALAQCTTIHHLQSFANQLVSNFDPESCLSFAPSPAYSLSKAFLNKATHLMQQSVNDKAMGHRVRVLAVCPGNFHSPMTTTEELAAEQANFMLSPDQAVEYFLPVIKNTNNRFPGGYFYRYGQRIPF